MGGEWGREWRIVGKKGAVLTGSKLLLVCTNKDVSAVCPFSLLKWSCFLNDATERGVGRNQVSRVSEGLLRSKSSPGFSSANTGPAERGK